jgi:hypothetical protein
MRKEKKILETLLDRFGRKSRHASGDACAGKILTERSFRIA